jgi:predicted transcriptional regulator of viral defense system
MAFRDFERTFRSLPVIPLAEVHMRFPGLHRRNLHTWQQKGYLQKVRSGYYRLADRPLNDPERWAIANTCYAPSYVSLRSALAFHGFIPEGVFHVESVTTNLTWRMAFADTSYSYRHVKPAFYYGYRFMELQGVRVMMAGPEKALLDLLYLEPTVAEAPDFEAWRLDAMGIRAAIDPARMDDFARLAGSKALLHRYTNLMNWLHDHAG